MSKKVDLRASLNRHVVYTCLFGFSEYFSDFDYGDQSVDYVCFTDDPELTSRNWQFVCVQNPSLDPARFAKRYKHLPHLFLPEYESSIYIDNTVKLKVEPSAVFQRFGNHEMVMMRHPQRGCLYDEASEIIRRRYDEPEIVNRQMEVYRRAGYPTNNGLNAGTFLLRTHSSQAMRETTFEWHTQVLQYSKRDQLSWNFCAWMKRFFFTSVDEELTSNSIFDWPVMASPERIPRDFNDEVYLSLHPDVKAAGMNPRKHYLKYGFREKRRFR